MGSTSRRRAVLLALLAIALLVVGIRRPWEPRVAPVAQSNPANPDDPSAEPDPSATADGTAKKDKTKPPLDLPRTVSLPGNWQRQDLFIKPGHWTSLWVEGESTTGDYRGALSTELAGRNGEPLALTPQRRRLDTVRSVVFPNADPRVAEQYLFTPNYYDQNVLPVFDPVAGPPPLRASSNRLPRSSPSTHQYLGAESTLRGAGLQLELSQRAGSSVEFRTKKPTFALRNHQSLFVVLSSNPAGYRSFVRLNLINAYPGHDEVPSDQYSHYRFVNADDLLRAPLASHFSGWTTTAYLVWDGYDPELLTAEQRKAMLDWLHWGGRMVVVGPQSLETLGRSFLAPYLPARSVGSKELDASSLAPLDEWTITGGAPQRTKAWPGVHLELNEGGQAILGGTAGTPTLVAERRLGRGRIIVTAFRLTQPELTDWPSFDGFLNGCLLGRSARIWDDGAFAHNKAQIPFWKDQRQTSWYDPREISDVRYAVRDAVATPNIYGKTWVGPGTAAWRDDGDAPVAARRILQEEAGIVIPSVGVVVTIVGIYLFVLVPLNGLFFYWLGKVEWAWFAAPVISLLFAGAVVRIAQLDIGFARSMSEVAVVELQPGYARAHVSRFGAVYNSLGTDYTLVSEEPTTIMLPFAPAITPNAGPEGTVRLASPDAADGTTAKIKLEEFLVESNSTSMYRTEQMADVGGSLKFELLEPDRARLTNGTSLSLENVQLSGRLHGSARFLAPQASVEIELHPGANPEDSDSSAPGQLAYAVQQFDGAVLRLTAWSTTEVPGLNLEPAPSQQRRKTLVVAHLEYAPLIRSRDADIPKPRPNDDEADAP